MRNQFVSAITKLAQNDSRVFLICGDLGFGVLNDFIEKNPKQFLNAGIAEQNIIGLATGMALEGRIVFTYSIGNFLTIRCVEQIRNDAAYHGANVKIVSVGGGFCYGPLGASHHATEDLGVLRTIPGMTVSAPGDPQETASATEQVYQHEGTCYLRLGRGGEPLVHRGGDQLNYGEVCRLYDGEEVLLLATGGALANADQARKLLLAQGVDVGLYSVPYLKPFDAPAISEAAARVKLIVTVEEHRAIGGLGSAVAEVVAQMDAPKAKLKIMGLPDCFIKEVGSQQYLQEKSGLSAQHIAETVKKEI